MKFITVKENQEIYKPVDNRYIDIQTLVSINADEISLIRETKEGLLIFMTGRDKAIKITDSEEIDKVLKECKINKRTLNE